MSVHYQRQIEHVKDLAVNLADSVRRRVRLALQAVREADDALADEVIDGAARIHEAARVIAEECLHTLACYAPVASDLRYVVAVQKMAADLQRITDHGCRIAAYADAAIDELPDELIAMADETEAMLQRAFTALLAVDPDKARRVIDADDRVDALHSHLEEQIETELADRSERVAPLLAVLDIARQLERIADLAVNLAEDVIYMANGDIVRHRHPPDAPRA